MNACYISTCKMHLQVLTHLLLSTSYRLDVIIIHVLLTQFSSIQSLSRVWLFATPWTAAVQASLSITNLDLAHTHVHQVSDAIQPSHLLSSPSPPAFNLSQHQGLFQGASSFHHVAKVLELQLQHQFFQWIFWIDFL